MTAEQRKRVSQGRARFLATGGSSPMKGRTHSPEARAKMSTANMGKPSYWKGKSLSAERRQAISDRMKGTVPWNFTGDTLRWTKMQALKRDDYTCQECGLQDREVVQVDHIKPKSLFPELATALGNLTTLCANCHMRKTRRNREWHPSVAIANHQLIERK